MTAVNTTEYSIFLCSVLSDLCHPSVSVKEKHKQTNENKMLFGNGDGEINMI